MLRRDVDRNERQLATLSVPSISPIADRHEGGLPAEIDDVIR